MSDEKQVFWNTGDQEFNKSNSRMYRSGDVVSLEVEDFDSEDLRRYDYSATLKWQEYLELVEKLQKGESGSLKSVNDKTSVFFAGSSDGFVMITLSGSPSPCSSPGGTCIQGSPRIVARLDTLLPK